MKKYLKAFILLPLIIQIIGTIGLMFANNDADGFQSSAITVFIVAAVPTFLITLWAAFHRYASYHVKAIALISVLIGFCYTVVAGIFYATRMVTRRRIRNYLLNGRRFGTLFCYGITALVTERTPTIRRFEANIEPLNPPNLLMKLTALYCFLAKVWLNFVLKHPVPT